MDLLKSIANIHIYRLDSTITPAVVEHTHLTHFLLVEQAATIRYFPFHQVPITPVSG